MRVFNIFLFRFTLPFSVIMGLVGGAGAGGGGAGGGGRGELMCA